MTANQNSGCSRQRTSMPPQRVSVRDTHIETKAIPGSISWTVDSQFTRNGVDRRPPQQTGVAFSIEKCSIAMRRHGSRQKFHELLRRKSDRVNRYGWSLKRDPVIFHMLTCGAEDTHLPPNVSRTNPL